MRYWINRPVTNVTGLLVMAFHEAVAVRDIREKINNNIPIP